MFIGISFALHMGPQVAYISYMHYIYSNDKGAVSQRKTENFAGNFYGLYRLVIVSETPRHLHLHDLE